jgi:hypothetical protein
MEGKQTHMIPSSCPSKQDHFHLIDKPEARPILDLAGIGEQSDQRRIVNNPHTNGARLARSDDRGSEKRPRPNIGKTTLEIMDEAMQKTLTIDEYIEHEARIMYTYRMLSMSRYAGH